MCWNPQISLTTFIFAICAITISYINRITDIKWAIFYFTIAAIQLIEYFIWTQKSYNRILSILGFIIITIQPIAAGLVISNATYQKIYYISYFVWGIIAIIDNFRNGSEFTTTVGKTKHLRWNWLKPSLFFVITWTMFLITGLWLSNKYSLIDKLIMAVFTSLFCATAYYFYSKDGTWGSIYCSMANMIFLYILAKSFYSLYMSRYGCL
jgi:hypothetical protein